MKLNVMKIGLITWLLLTLAAVYDLPALLLFLLLLECKKQTEEEHL